MKGYIYSMYGGADPGAGWVMNDPILKPIPTLGACVPNIRKWVSKGDWIFTISGRKNGLQQYIVAGFSVDEKINQLAAYDRFPDLRMHVREDGVKSGNIIVDADGNRNPHDDHSNWLNRLDNYIIGKDPVIIEQPAEISRGRMETVHILEEVFQKKGDKVFEIIGRCRKLTEEQISMLTTWMISLKSGGNYGSLGPSY
jgi:hypothetical protein